MGRTIAEIKNEMTDLFIGNDTIKELYGLKPNGSFDDQFSKVSLESILFYVVAACAWTLENLFDRHRQEVTELINELKPHSLRWYANKAKAFQFGKSLPEPELKPDSDEYDNTGKTDEEIEKERVVKYAAVEDKEAIVYVKVATGAKGARTPLTAEQEEALNVYFKKVKDAGVKLSIVNQPANLFNIRMEVYYDPMVFNSQLGMLSKPEVQPVHHKIADFVENLPFNGEYRNSALIAELLQLEGVVLVELREATCDGEVINARCVPESGYFRVDKEMLGINAIAYETLMSE